MILVDYACRGCGAVQERWTSSPPPTALTCACGRADARRVWAAIGLSRAAPVPAAAEPKRRGPTLCQRYPQLPGICHMSEDAARMWVAKYRGDKRAVDTEQAAQETRAKDKPPVLADAITHQHYPSVPAGGATP